MEWTIISSSKNGLLVYIYSPGVMVSKLLSMIMMVESMLDHTMVSLFSKWYSWISLLTSSANSRFMAEEKLFRYLKQD